MANWAHALSCKAILTSIKGENVLSGNQDSILCLKIKASLKIKISLYRYALVNNFDIKNYILILIFSTTNIQQKKNNNNCVALFNSRCILVVVKDNFKQKVFNMQTEADRCLIYMHFENSGMGAILFFFLNYFDFIVLFLNLLNNFVHIYQTIFEISSIFLNLIIKQRVCLPHFFMQK